jgi:hypothetical protein
MFSWTALSSSGTKPSQPNRTVTVGRKTIIAAAHQYYVFARGPPNGDRSAGKIVNGHNLCKIALLRHVVFGHNYATCHQVQGTSRMFLQSCE